jgi:hypothetical protein
VRGAKKPSRVSGAALATPEANARPAKSIALRLLAVERDTTINALAIEAFNGLLKKYGKRQSVEKPLLD